MSDKNVAVFGIYPTRIAVEGATDALNTAGFHSTDISLLIPQGLDGSDETGNEADAIAPQGSSLLVIPGVGRPLLAAGPIVAGLTSLGAGGAADGIVGALVDMGLPEYEAKRYEARLQIGGILLSVHCGNADEIARAKGIVESRGGEHISSSGESMVETVEVPMAAAGSLEH